ncbi:MAG: hypothetical protein JZU52_08485 [Lamprocystis purpurea]|jgi:hypothetical protein|uniref:hypothetical protein n=1 Tax=Lamprocystis purpurea TaxID=61598 RepID=UPI00037DBF0A|nr:hypothetical protein [Lamprocystis purpurea]MBV5273665.1 hypothetical protein [Lamprocystis purpurea]
MSEEELLRNLAAIPIGQGIPGMNKGTVYRFVGIGLYDSHGRARDFDGWQIVTLDSPQRNRPHIRLFVSVLATFLKDGKASLTYGGTPRSVILTYRRGDGPGIPNLVEYGSHYKSLARYVFLHRT